MSASRSRRRLRRARYRPDECRQLLLAHDSRRTEAATSSSIVGRERARVPTLDRLLVVVIAVVVVVFVSGGGDGVGDGGGGGGGDGKRETTTRTGGDTAFFRTLVLRRRRRTGHNTRLAGRA